MSNRDERNKTRPSGVQGTNNNSRSQHAPLRSLMTTSMWILPAGNQFEPAHFSEERRLSKENRMPTQIKEGQHEAECVHFMEQCTGRLLFVLLVAVDEEVLENRHQLINEVNNGETGNKPTQASS
jgi:hypothetical protein